jgi:phosphatidate cytidylyltransferase
MLKTRVLTALALLPLAWWLVFRVGADGFTLAAAAILLIGSWEFARLAGIRLLPGGTLLIIMQAAIMALLTTTWEEWTANPILPFGLACLAWLAMFTQLYFYRPDAKADSRYRLRGCFNALAALTFGWMALAWLRHEPAGEWWILLLLLAIWASDIGAYFTGKALGKTKMAPGISPGKTWAGLVGGLALAAVAPAAAQFIPGLDVPVIPLAIICVVTALASVGGDLFISMHKRTMGLKDTGRILPGHGGILDRLDSLLAGAPFFVLGKLLAGL